MTQFSSEAPNNVHHGYSKDVHQFIDSPNSHDNGDKPPTMTLHLSNVMGNGGTNQGNPNHYYHPNQGGFSSVNTTSHNLCTTTNNTMMMGLVEPRQPAAPYTAYNDQNTNVAAAFNNPMIMQRNGGQPGAQINNNVDESGFYSQNDFVMTNSQGNTPNSNFNTAGT
jgi:hypothetical protein